MSDITIGDIQQNLIHMNLSEYDYIWNVRMPIKDCEICGGNAVAEWDGDNSVLCECLVSTDTSREPMKFGLLWKLANVTKKQVYDEKS